MVALRQQALQSDSLQTNSSEGWRGRRWDDGRTNPLHAGRADQPPSLRHPTRPPPAVLARAVEREIIPRLLLSGRAAAKAHVAARADTAPCRPSAPDPKEVGEFARLVLDNDVPLVWPLVEAMRARGTTTESLYLDLLAPAARYLGKLWDEDLCDFTQVTVALLRMQQVMRELSPAFLNDVERLAHNRRALLLPAPGDQHTFGLAMVAEFFRRAGWNVACGPQVSRQDLAALVCGQWIAVIGFSVSCELRLDALASSIRTVRRVSRNPAIGVMVGGPIFVQHPELVALVGADATAADGRQAALQAENLLALLPRGC